ncbi:MBL fold metallo-hydrolase [Mucilaginibacter conchicola]|uniref:MBL fold metallo-hydrolase n=1 Tax=Mucilaginibacter conchicola TaxID=2303333 RepID=A0A372NY96_9SPHI|nr:MBL fold metallo-hydrolase [Mucilaginibacter conchicola]RFZ95086.1 MBL fold metallo-hydrolase [Mucilaginibacter conchicola]
MKISKFLHSCLVFEDKGYKLLFDPGKFTFAEGRVKPDDFTDVHAIIITHIHPDHLDTENLKKIVELSNAPVYTNDEVGEALAKEGLSYQSLKEGTFELGPFKLQAFPVQHEPLLDNPIPQMTGFIINDKVLHPVDSMETRLTEFPDIEVLIMVTMAPFANELRIAGFADRVRPKQILPVHDGYAKEFFLKQRYDNYQRHFAKTDIKFHQIIEIGDGISI